MKRSQKWIGGLFLIIALSTGMSNYTESKTVQMDNISEADRNRDWSAETPEVTEPETYAAIEPDRQINEDTMSATPENTYLLTWAMIMSGTKQQGKHTFSDELIENAVNERSNLLNAGREMCSLIDKSTSANEFGHQMAQATNIEGVSDENGVALIYATAVSATQNLCPEQQGKFDNWMSN